MLKLQKLNFVMKTHTSAFKLGISVNSVHKVQNSALESALLNLYLGLMMMSKEYLLTYLLTCYLISTTTLLVYHHPSSSTKSDFVVMTHE